MTFLGNLLLTFTFLASLEGLVAHHNLKANQLRETVVEIPVFPRVLLFPSQVVLVWDFFHPSTVAPEN